MVGHMSAEAVVLGGGFYGCKVAVALKALGLRRVVLIEPGEIGAMATTANQNRVHGGYHYPRSLVTADSARKNYVRFLADHAYAIDKNRRHMYGIAKGSKTSSRDFIALCGRIGAPLSLPTIEVAHEFTNLVESLWEVDEVAFNIEKMQELLEKQLHYAKVDVRKGYGRVAECDDTRALVVSESEHGKLFIDAEYVFNCTYANIDKVGVTVRTKLKKEFTEVALVKAPDEISNTDITIMDGLYWSLMRYPSKECHALTHVLFTPHYEWFPPEQESYKLWHSGLTNHREMIADAARFVPVMAKCEYISSLYTTRVVLADNENDDGRPVLFEYAPESPRVISILGSKFNSIYDVLDKLASGEWRKTSHVPSLRVVGRRALIGRGFIGASLDKPGRFTDRYNSTNIETMAGHYDTIVIAAPSAEKWRANARPDDDMESILQLQNVLGRVTADHVTLISTIDAYKSEHYGHNRRILEGFVRARFENAKVLRLPALYGPGLKKNVLFDILCDHPISHHPDSTFQWYDVRELWHDIRSTKPGTLREFFPAPITVRWLYETMGKNIPPNTWRQPTTSYDFRNEDGEYTESIYVTTQKLADWIRLRRQA